MVLPRHDPPANNAKSRHHAWQQHACCSSSSSSHVCESCNVHSLGFPLHVLVMTAGRAALARNKAGTTTAATGSPNTKPSHKLTTTLARPGSTSVLLERCSSSSHTAAAAAGIAHHQAASHEPFQHKTYGLQKCDNIHRWVQACEGTHNAPTQPQSCTQWCWVPRAEDIPPSHAP